MYNKNWYNNLKKSPYNPPSWVFGRVWPILYLMIFLSFKNIINEEKCKNWCKPLNFFVIQLILNLTWTTIFFRLRRLKLALIQLILIIILTFITIKEFYKINKIASYLLIPYFIWLLFALHLNFYIVNNNKI